MRKCIFKLAVVMAALLVSMGSMAQSNKVNNFRIKRGTNVSHWLSQSEQRGEARRLHIQEDDPHQARNECESLAVAVRAAW